MNQLPILYLVSLLMDMSVAAVIFAISRRAAELGASASDLGWLGAVWIGLYAVLALVTGRVSDRVGPSEARFRRMCHRGDHDAGVFANDADRPAPGVQCPGRRPSYVP